jgi:hypothetical protein
MIDRLAEFPGWVLDAAIQRAPRDFDWLPSIKEMIQLCCQMWEPQRHAAAAISAMEAEHQRRQEAIAEQRRRREADARYCSQLRACMVDALGETDAPGLTDIDAAWRIMPVVRIGGRSTSWRHFTEREPRAAAQLCARLAAIVRGAGDGKNPRPNRDRGRSSRRGIAAATAANFMEKLGPGRPGKMSGFG